MKRRILAIATTLAIVVPAWMQSAFAQDDSAGDDSAPSSVDESAPPPDASEGQNGQIAMPRPPSEGQAPPSSAETHTVVTGDTLWDLSQKYLGNPWYWPKVWSYNPQIANPHWIYPGNQVNFFPNGKTGDAEAPTQVDQPTASAEPLDDLSGDDDMVRVTRQIGYVPPRTSSFRQDGFITDRELEESGQISKSFAEKEMLDNYDKVYCRFKSTGDARPGDRFFIYNTVKEINHPITGKHYGYMTHIVGTMKVTEVANGIVEGFINHTYDVIKRGAYLAPYSDKLSKRVDIKAASQQINGYVMDSLAQLSDLGEATVVFVDKGKRDGLESGNVLDVIRRGDGVQMANHKPGEAGYEDKKLPAEVIGRLLVVDVKDSASTCLTLRSMREFQAGDRFMTSATPGASVTQR